MRKTLLLDFVRALPRSAPPDVANVVIIEDLHWIDAASLEFVDALADAVFGTTTLLVVNFRPGFAAALMQRSHYRQINMLPLAKTQAAILVQDHFGPDPSLALLSRNIIERAQGNPFFLEELINAPWSSVVISKERRAPNRLKGGIDTIPLPPTVQAVPSRPGSTVFTSRAKQVLEMASVVGPRDIAVDPLDTIAGLAPGDPVGSTSSKVAVCRAAL